MKVPTLQRSNLPDEIISEIKQAILDGELLPGDWLPAQADLAKRFGVGLSTLREAVRGLTLLGILLPQQGRGTRVSSEALSLVHMLDLIGTRLEEVNILKLYEARRVIEVELTRLAAERATADDIDRIAAAVEKMRQALTDDKAFLEADLEFHFAVAHAGKNPLLEGFYHLSRGMLTEAIGQLIRIPGITEVSLGLQEDISNAIRSRNPRAAERSAERLMKHLSELLRASLSVGGGMPGREAC